jgi:hypothetical protein
MTLQQMKINQTRYRGICFMQEDKGRDTEIAIPIVHAARRFLNCEIDFELKWNAHLLYKRKVDFIIVPANCVGSLMYHRIAKYAYEQGIRVFSFVSEGNFRTDIDFNIYGFNTDNFFYNEYICAWSKRTFHYFKKKLPWQADKVVLTGAPGFDRYKIYEFADRATFLKKYNKEKFSKVICYSGWAFGKLQYQQGREELEADPSKRAAKLHWVEQQRMIVRDTLKAAIENNPDKLFILKQHPAEYYPGLKLAQRVNEMTELVAYPNVLYIEENQEDIHDLISVTDILLGFETTTAIETWLMKPGAPTIFINSEPGFPRVDIYKGCAIVDGYTALKPMIEEFYTSGKVSAFETPERAAKRNDIVTNTIGFSDGLNHLRTIYFLNEMLKRIDRSAIHYKPNRRFLVGYLYFKMLRPFYSRRLFDALPKISKTTWVFERHCLPNIPVLQNRYGPFLDRFYLKMNVDSEAGLLAFWEDNLREMIDGI